METKTTSTMSVSDNEDHILSPGTKGLMGKIFKACSSDPRGSVHRAWGISLLFVVFYFVLAVIEMINLQSNGGSIALVIASIWTGFVHLTLGILGTFVLKRFPTSFSIGFLLGVLVVLANQNLIMFAAFSRYDIGSTRTNHAFATLGFILSCVLTFMALLLVNFKSQVVVAPIDVNVNVNVATTAPATSNYDMTSSKARQTATA